MDTKYLFSELTGKDIDNNEVICNECGQLFLLLSKHDRIPPRNIGKIMFDSSGQPHYIKHVDKRKHFFKKANAWGVNAFIAKVLSGYGGIVMFITGSEVYKLPASDIIKHKYTWFKKQGFEKQILVPLDAWQTEPMELKAI